MRNEENKVDEINGPTSQCVTPTAVPTAMDDSKFEIRVNGPRERLRRYGPKVLSDAEVLAILLGTGVKGIPVMTLAHDLLRHSGGLRGLLNVSAKKLPARGLGPVRLARLIAAKELAVRASREALMDLPLMNSPSAVRDHLHLCLSDLPHEVFNVLFLDAQHRLIALEEMFRGSLNQTSVHPREVVKRALIHNAGAVILAHNHPSGIAEPSKADEVLTQTLVAALNLIDVRVLDHVIVAGHSSLSFAERGLLQT